MGDSVGGVSKLLELPLSKAHFYRITGFLSADQRQKENKLMLMMITASYQ
jgi:hypothetical protein